MNIWVRNRPAFRIDGGRVLIGGSFNEATVLVDGESGTISAVDRAHECSQFRADGLLVLPGIVDIHGDAFERQLMPRPGVGFPLDIAFADSDRQSVANGITTVFHGITWSWEPGLRGSANARATAECIERMRPQLAADTRIHIRFETFNLDAEAEIIGWLKSRRIDVLAFNDHMTSIANAPDRDKKVSPMIERSGVSRDRFLDVVERAVQRAGEVPELIVRIAAAANASNVPLLSHDDTSPARRSWYRALGCRLAEFPTTAETAQAAAAAGDDIVLGAPNVVRGGSHTGWINAAEMIARGYCSILASDYYYPAPLHAAFRLAADGVLPLEDAWRLVSVTPAKAVGLDDRGRIAPGHRADLVFIDASDLLRPRVVATMVRGRFVHVADTSRISL